MSGDSRSHLTSGFQRRFLRISITLAVVLIIVATPLIVNADLRFDLAQRFGLVPDLGVEHLDYDPETTDLIVIPSFIERRGTVPEVRFRAHYLAETLPDRVRLTDLDDNTTFDLPINAPDFVSASPDGENVLFRAGMEPANARGVTVDTRTNTVTALPPGQLAPTDDPWWSEPVWATAPELCNAVSPNAVLIACYQRPVSRFLAGDWQINVQRYGDPDQSVAVYRGQGLRPIIGWSGGDDWLYFQNERVIGRARITTDQLSAT